MNMNYKKFIGVYDSGVGGISILKKLKEYLPYEDFLYYGDSANAPYGGKRKDDIILLADDSVKKLIAEGVKAVVVACNTATSAAIDFLRDKYTSVPIVGVEPALKPAIMHENHGRILVMATQATLRLEKFHKLEEKYVSEEEMRNVIILPCPGLVDEIEKGDPHSPPVVELLNEFLSPYKEKIRTVVLGCTHYPFLKDEIRAILGNIIFYDSGDGTAKELKRKLEEKSIQKKETTEGKIVFTSSKDTFGEIEMYKRFFEEF